MGVFLFVAKVQGQKQEGWACGDQWTQWLLEVLWTVQGERFVFFVFFFFCFYLFFFLEGVNEERTSGRRLGRAKSERKKEEKKQPWIKEEQEKGRKKIEIML